MDGPMVPPVGPMALAICRLLQASQQKPYLICLLTTSIWWMNALPCQAALEDCQNKVAI